MSDPMHAIVPCGLSVSQPRWDAASVDPVFKAVWRSAKNELTYFAEWYKKDSSQIRKMFTFPDEKQTKTPFEMSKHPSFKLSDDNRLKLLLKDYPKEKFYK